MVILWIVAGVAAAYHQRQRDAQRINRKKKLFFPPAQPASVRCRHTWLFLSFFLALVAFFSSYSWLAAIQVLIDMILLHISSD